MSGKHRLTRLEEVPCFYEKENIEVYTRTYELSKVVIYDCENQHSRLIYSYFEDCDSFSKNIIMLYD